MPSLAFASVTRERENRMTGADQVQQLPFDANHILAAFPQSVHGELAREAALVKLTKGKRLFEQGERPEHLLFPLSGSVVVLSLDVAGRAVPVALLDSFSLVGASLAETILPAAATATVLLPGAAVAIPRALLQTLTIERREVRDAIARGNDALLAQLMQGSACHLRHGLEARLADALHALHASGGLSELPMTQNELADLLVAQRTSVTAAASLLQKRGLIDYRRGQIVVRDPLALGASGCRCWNAIDAHRRRLFA